MSTDPPVRVVLWDADGVLQRVPGGGEESMRPAVQDRLHDVDAFLAEALREERPALTGEARWVEVLAQLLERWGSATPTRTCSPCG
jgi:putative hydrolase of the HAD superfamily